MAPFTYINKDISILWWTNWFPNVTCQPGNKSGLRNQLQGVLILLKNYGSLQQVQRIDDFLHAGEEEMARRLNVFDTHVVDNWWSHHWQAWWFTNYRRFLYQTHLATWSEIWPKAANCSYVFWCPLSKISGSTTGWVLNRFYLHLPSRTLRSRRSSFPPPCMSHRSNKARHSPHRNALHRCLIIAG